MLTRCAFAAALFCAAALGVSGARGTFPADAQDKPKAKGKVAEDPIPSEKDAELDVEFIESLAAADRMAEAGRDTKSPEMLIAAGSMYRKLSVQYRKPKEVKEIPTGEKDELITEKPLPSPDMTADAAEMFNAARGTTKVPDQIAAINVLIAAAEKRDYSKKERGAVGGPKMVTRRIAGGGTHTYHIPYFTQIPAALAVRTSGIRIRCRMVHQGYVHFEQVVRIGQYSWIPKADTGRTKMFTLTIHNVDKGGGQYTLTTN